jgi:hypothetical protein
MAGQTSYLIANPSSRDGSPDYEFTYLEKYNNNLEL